jgi:elongation factor G
MDSVDSEKKFEDSLVSIKEKLRAVPLAVQLPIGFGKELKGVVDLVEEKAYYFSLGDVQENYQIQSIPSYLLDKSQQ